MQITHSSPYYYETGCACFEFWCYQYLEWVLFICFVSALWYIFCFFYISFAFFNFLIITVIYFLIYIARKYICVYVYACVFVRVCLQVCLCFYIYMKIYTSIHIDICLQNLVASQTNNAVPSKLPRTPSETASSTRRLDLLEPEPHLSEPRTLQLGSF